MRLLRFTGILLFLLMGEHVLAVPKVKFTESAYSWGKIQQHAVLTKRFWIKTTSNQPAKITEATPDCGCTTLELRDSLVRPGDSVAMDVTLHTRYFIGFTEKRPYLMCEGSEEKTILKLYAEIMPQPETARPLVMSPTRVDVSQYGEKPRRKATFTLTNLSSFDYDFKIVDSAFKDFDIILPAKIPAGQKVEGQIIVHKDAVTKGFEQSATFEINDDGLSRYSVPVWRLYQPSASPVTPSGK